MGDVREDHAGTRSADAGAVVTILLVLSIIVLSGHCAGVLSWSFREGLERYPTDDPMEMRAGQLLVYALRSRGSISDRLNEALRFHANRLGRAAAVLSLSTVLVSVNVWMQAGWAHP